MLNYFNGFFLNKLITLIIKMNKKPLLYRFIEALYLKKELLRSLKVKFTLKI